MMSKALKQLRSRSVQKRLDAANDIIRDGGKFTTVEIVDALVSHPGFAQMKGKRQLKRSFIAIFAICLSIGNQANAIRLNEIEKQVQPTNKINKEIINSNSNASINCHSASECCEIGSEQRDLEQKIKYYTNSLIFDENGNCGTTSSNGYAFFERANAYCEMDEYDLAIIDYTNAIANNPYDVGFYQRRGDCYSYDEKYEHALSDYYKAIELQPEVPLFYYRVTTIFERTLDYEAAVNTLTKAIELNISLNEEECYDYAKRGQLYSNIGDVHSAIKDYSKAIELNSNSSNYFRDRGILYMRIDEIVKAIGDFNKAILIDPSNSYYFVDRAIAHAKIGNDHAALSDFTHAIDLNPQNPHHYVKRAEYFSSKFDSKRELEDLNTAIELNPNDPTIYNRRASARLWIDDYCGAIEDYKKVADLDSDTDDLAIKKLAELYYAVDDFDNSILYSNKYIENNPDNPCIYYIQGDAYLGKEMYEEAIGYFGMAIQLDSDLSNAYERRGYAYYQNQDCAKAVEDYNETIKLREKQNCECQCSCLCGKWGETYRKRGDAHTCIGNYEKAISDYEIYLELVHDADDRKTILNLIDELKKR